MNIHEYCATELLASYKTKKLTPTEVVTALYERIDQYNPFINAFVTLNKEEAFKQAELSTHVYRSDNPNPKRRLEGVPVAIKDLTHTKNLRTTYGSTLYKNYIPDRDATVVERLKKAGAIIIGKTNTPEFGYKATTDNPLFGPTRNPWNPAKASGGSSGGSAASVAAGFVPLAEGSDGGGSIRIPASLTSVYGFKASYGRVPNDNHLDGVFGSHEPFIHYGTLSRSVRDAALMFDVMQGASHYDPFSLPDLTESPVEALNSLPDPRSIKIGYTLDFGIYEIDSAVTNLFFTSIQKLKNEGFQVEEIHIDMKKNLREFIAYFENLWTAGLAASASSWGKEQKAMLSEGFLKMAEQGAALSAIEYKKLEHYRAYLFHTFQSAFGNVDFILSPTLAVPAFAYDKEGPAHINGKTIKIDADWVMTQMYNLTGQPAISIPMGFTEQRLPAGIQAAGARLNDIKLLQLAYRLETCLQTPALASLSSLDINASFDIS